MRRSVERSTSCMRSRPMAAVGCRVVAFRERRTRSLVEPLRRAEVVPTTPRANVERETRSASGDSVSARPPATFVRARLRLPSLEPVASGRLGVPGVPAARVCTIAAGAPSGTESETGTGTAAGIGADSGTAGDAASAIGGVGAGAEAGGAGAGGAAGVGGGMGTARGGSRDSGSTYVSSAPTRMPRCTYGTSCSETPVGPASASGAPSTTRSPRLTRSGPRWVKETL